MQRVRRWSSDTSVMQTVVNHKMTLSRVGTGFSQKIPFMDSFMPEETDVY